MPAYRYFIEGRVQGVGYRYFAVREAERLRVSGFARNLPDGRVEVVAEGEEKSLSEFETRLNEGPSFADVSRVERSPIPLRGDDGFYIR